MRSRRALLRQLFQTRNQRGAVLLVMLVILIMGALGFLVSELSKASLQTSRDNKSSDLLAKSKEALLGYAVSGGSRPGDLPYQDRLATPSEPNNGNYDGDQDGCAGPANCLGRLPWRTLGMSIDSPSENDPTGFMPWYAVSANLADPAGVTLNSELLNAAPHPWLTVRDMNGNILSNRVAFVIIIPGPPINGQSRPSSPNLAGADQYLDSITVPAGCTAPCTPGITYSNADLDDNFITGNEHRWTDDPANPGSQIEDPGYHFNDKLIYVTIDELMPLIEKRIAREVKTCLDDYAAASAGKYPWATPTGDTTYTGTYNTLFGRIPNQPDISTSTTGSAAAATLTTALNSLQTALDNYFAIGNIANRAALIAAGNNVISLKDSLPATSVQVNTAGSWAVQFAFGTHTYAGVTGKITTAQTSVAGAGIPTDSSMSAAWPASCTLFTTSTYWADWKAQVFYQVADGYQPNSAPGCINCLFINGSGNSNAGSGSYRAAIAVAGKKIGTQTRAAQVVSEYLDMNNQTNKSATPSNYTFDTYKTTDTHYSTVNDLVLCLDGKNNCK